MQPTKTSAEAEVRWVSFGGGSPAVFLFLLENGFRGVRLGGCCEKNKSSVVVVVVEKGPKKVFVHLCCAGILIQPF